MKKDTRLESWAFRCLTVASILFLLSFLNGLLFYLTIFIIAPLSIIGLILYSMLWHEGEGNTQLLIKFGVAWSGATMSIGLISKNAGGFFFWAMPVVLLAYAFTLTKILTPFHTRKYILLGLLTMSFVVIPLMVIRNGGIQLNQFEPYETSLLYLQLQLFLGADANQTDTGKPILEQALETGRADLVCLLLEYGANPNARNKHWKPSTQTPILFTPIFDKHPELVNLMLSSGADPFACDVYGRDALIIASDYKYPDSLGLQKYCARLKKRNN